VTTGAAPDSALVPDDAPTPVGTPAPVAVAGRPRWVLFAVLAAAVLVIDQLVKSWVAGSFQVGVPVPVLGEALRITVSHNQGALFGLFQGSAVVFGLVSLLVVGLIVWYEARAGASLIVSIALGLLLGGAMGNLTDRLRLGYVIDFVDAGLGDVRWFTFNLSDVAIDGAILLLILVALLPERRAERPA
jgi:signal peptidase II